MLVFNQNVNLNEEFNNHNVNEDEVRNETNKLRTLGFSLIHLQDDCACCQLWQYMDNEDSPCSSNCNGINRFEVELWDVCNECDSENSNCSRCFFNN